MRVLVTGATGQLGYDCLRECLKRDQEVIGSGLRFFGSTFTVRTVNQDQITIAAVPYVQFDISRLDQVYRAVEKNRPDVIIHCAAWTDVNAAELPENREKVFSVNALGTENVAKAARSVGAKMIYISTDYVFDGHGKLPWKPEDVPAPLNLYGRSKLEGEKKADRVLENLFVVRSSWAFGVNGRNFIRTMLREGKTKDIVRVVDDQVGAPTYTLDLARFLLDLAETEEYGRYHVTNEGGYLSRYELCLKAFENYGICTHVIPITTKEFGVSPADRPLNSRLDTSRLLEKGFMPLPLVDDAISRYLKEEMLLGDST